MKKLILLILIFYSFVSSAQTWKSIGKLNSYETNSVFQFSINPYTNDIWMVGHNNYGLYSFENYTPTMRCNFSSNTDAFTEISSNEDTIYVCFTPPSFV